MSLYEALLPIKHLSFDDRQIIVAIKTYINVPKSLYEFELEGCLLMKFERRGTIFNSMTYSLIIGFITNYKLIVTFRIDDYDDNIIDIVKTYSINDLDILLNHLNDAMSNDLIKVQFIDQICELYGCKYPNISLASLLPQMIKSANN